MGISGSYVDPVLPLFFDLRGERWRSVRDHEAQN